tara:strand:+ start:371 stop:586 length:216 start_codon:yes stop_codon:yes gene_type:complete
MAPAASLRGEHIIPPFLKKPIFLTVLGDFAFNARSPAPFGPSGIFFIFSFSFSMLLHAGAYRLVDPNASSD